VSNSLVGVACSEIADGDDLNVNISTSANNTNLPISDLLGLSAFGINVTGLFDGEWNLAFNALTSTSVRLTREVPEPGIRALMGVGLAGLGFMSRRRKV
jgi:hypothetical protein